MVEHEYRQIGILGGMGPESTTDLYLRILQEHRTVFRDEFYPDITLRSVNTGRVFDILDAVPLDRKALVDELAPHLASLAFAGADFAVIAANTPHIVFDELQNGVNMRLRSIVDATRDEALRLQVERPLLLGTLLTMTDGFFHRPFTQAGIEVLTPARTDQQVIDGIISSGLFNSESREAILSIVRKYAFSGVILGCTELPMLIKPEDIDAPLLDTVDIQARDTLIQALA